MTQEKIWLEPGYQPDAAHPGNGLHALTKDSPEYWKAELREPESGVDPFISMRVWRRVEGQLEEHRLSTGTNDPAAALALLNETRQRLAVGPALVEEVGDGRNVERLIAFLKANSEGLGSSERSQRRASEATLSALLPELRSLFLTHGYSVAEFSGAMSEEAVELALEILEAIRGEGQDAR